MKASPKILVISNYSGALNPIRPEAEIFIGLIKQGFDITLISPEGGEYPAKFRALGAEVINYDFDKKIDPKGMSLIKSTTKRKGINIIHAFNSKALVNVILAMLTSPVKIVAYRGFTGNVFWYDPSCYVSILNPRIDRMVVIAESIRQMLIDNGMPKHRPVTIKKGHHPEWYKDIEAADLTEFNLPAGAMVCSFVANHRPKMKGLHALIRAMSLLKPDEVVYLLVMGSEMDKKDIKKLVAKSPHPERIIFTGFRKDASSLVKACDISISTSLYGEATQKAMIEAMFLGQPVIISNIPGNKGMVEDGVGGYIIEPGNEQSIASALSKFYNQPEKRSTMGLAAKAHIESFLSHETTIQEYGKLYQSLINNAD